ncbi:MAG: hypothetical protein LUH12_09165, partial [Bacteroides sp.]|nr:hypothetical protein [Bacteroides sp.]
MRNIVGTYVDRFLHERRTRTRAASVLGMLALVVAVGVFWQLHSTGIAMTNEVYCGLEEHEHTDACYELVLTCGYDEEGYPIDDESDEDETESVGHVHTADCYEVVSETTLGCPQEESAGHVHDEACYNEEGELICGLEEGEGAHKHDESCYVTTNTEVQICGMVEGELEETEAETANEPVHVHTDECYEKVLTCGKEAHVHTVECLIDETADLEDASDWEATLPDLTGTWSADVVAVAESQLGYTESEANFTLADDGETRQHYSRYGQWYGNPYGDWNVMFASFCYYYADVPEEDFPEASGAYAWAVKLDNLGLFADADDEDYEPAPGDLLFLITDEDGTRPDTVAIITAVSGSRLTVIQGDCDGEVMEMTYRTGDSEIYGYGVLPEQEVEETEEETEVETFTQTYTGNDYIVTVTYTADAEIPEYAELRATEYAKDSDVYQINYAEAAELYGWEDGTDYTDSVRLFDIGFYDGDNLEVEPKAEVQVTITYLEQEEEKDYTVTHFASEATETVETETIYENGKQSMSFGLGSFSPVMVSSVSNDATTVDEDGSGTNSYTFTYSWNFTVNTGDQGPGSGGGSSSGTENGSQTYTVYIVDEDGNIISSECITATSTTPSHEQTSSNNTYSLATLGANFTVTVNGTNYTYQGAYLYKTDSGLSTQATSIRYGSSGNGGNQTYSMQYSSSNSTGMGGNSWTSWSDTTIYLVYKDTSKVSTSFSSSLQSETYDHIDVKSSLATSSETTGYELTDVTGIYVYTSSTATSATYSATGSAISSENEGEWQSFHNSQNVTIYGSYTIVITYVVTDSSNEEHKYTATIDASSTYASGTSYAYNSENAYKLYNYLYGTNYSSNNRIDTTTYGSSFDLSGWSIYLVAAILCDTSNVRHGSVTIQNSTGLDFALDVGTLIKNSANFDLVVEKTLDGSSSMTENAFSFALSNASVSESDGSWTVGSGIQTVYNSAVTAGDGEDAVDTIGFTAIPYEAASAAGSTTYYYILTENNTNVSDVSYDTTVYAIAVTVTTTSSSAGSSSTVLTASVTSVTYYKLTLNNKGTGYTAEEISTITTNSDGEPVFPFTNYYNTNTSADVTIKKVDSNGNDLSGATFTLKNNSDEYYSVTDGTGSWSTVTEGGTTPTITLGSMD